MSHGVLFRLMMYIDYVVTMVPHDVSCCLMVYHVCVIYSVSWCLCLMMSHDVSWSCLVMSHGVLRCLMMSYGVLGYLMVSCNVSWCLMVFFMTYCV